MSRYLFLEIIFISVLFVGCTTSQPKKVELYDNIKPSLNEEDFLSLQALMYQYNDENRTKALEVYKKLYKEHGKLPFLKEAIKLSFQANDTKSRDNLLKDGIKKFPNDDDIMRLEVSRLLQNSEYKKAQKQMKKLLKKDKSTKNILILGTIYSLQKKYYLALREYKKAYKKDYSEKALLKLTSLLSENLKRKKQAISYLETHIRLREASEEVYQRLLMMYGKSYSIKGLISTYKLMYKKFQNSEYAHKVIDLYLYDKNTKGAIRFLEESGYEPLLLMDFYAQEQNFMKAYKVAERLYKQYDNIDYLGRMAIYEYEAHQKKLTKKALNSISKKFEEVIEKMQKPLYLNYYGYLLIDHNVDIPKGIKYVKMALEKEPDSFYYVDSLAWGYYKQKKCKEALVEMDKIIKKTDEQEIKEHYELILKCVKKQK